MVGGQPRSYSLQQNFFLPGDHLVTQLLKSCSQLYKKGKGVTMVSVVLGTMLTLGSTERASSLPVAIKPRINHHRKGTSKVKRRQQRQQRHLDCVLFSL